MLIGDLIANLRTTIKAHGNNTKYSDEFLYNLIKSARARVISEAGNKNITISIFNWQTICLPLEKTKYQDCSCIAVGCDILKSIEKIPSVVIVKGKPLIQIRTFNHMSLGYVTPDRQRFNKDSDTLSEKPAYFINDGKLIVWNNLDYKAIIVEGVFEDPSLLEEIKICNEDGDVYDICSYNPLEQIFPVEEAFIEPIINVCLRQLGMSLQIYTPNSTEPITRK